jgi:hypothetical protein
LQRKLTEDHFYVESPGLLTTIPLLFIVSLQFVDIEAHIRQYFELQTQSVRIKCFWSSNLYTDSVEAKTDCPNAAWLRYSVLQEASCSGAQPHSHSVRLIFPTQPLFCVSKLTVFPLIPPSPNLIYNKRNPEKIITYPSLHFQKSHCICNASPLVAHDPIPPSALVPTWAPLFQSTPISHPPLLSLEILTPCIPIGKHHSPFLWRACG